MTIDQFNNTVQFLREEMPNPNEHVVEVIPILHNDRRIILQMCGWAINLYSDGTWDYEGTEGG